MNDDWNPAPDGGYDLDSVQLVEMIDELRQAGLPFHISVAVSPFKYTEADCVYQYLKLEKKIAAGADYLVVGRPILEASDPKAAAQSIVAEIAQATGQ